jgi:hypothetical protein
MRHPKLPPLTPAGRGSLLVDLLARHFVELAVPCDAMASVPPSPPAAQSGAAKARQEPARGPR